MIYAKGWQTRSDGSTDDCFYKICEEQDKADIEPHREFGYDDFVVVFKLNDPNGRTAQFGSEEEAENAGYHFLREITKEEFELYLELKAIIKEVWLHGFTGGYPRVSALDRMLNRLPVSVGAYIKAIADAENAERR